jgi:hypothetical protein
VLEQPASGGYLWEVIHDMCERGGREEEKAMVERLYGISRGISRDTDKQVRPGGGGGGEEEEEEEEEEEGDVMMMATMMIDE